jgi:hypothetical protein
VTRPLPWLFALCIAASSSVGCSIFGAGLPKEPPADYHCPQGVVVADILGSALMLVPTLVGAVTIYKNDSDAAAVAVYTTPPAAILAVTYIGSALYGISQSRRCERMKEQAAEEWQANEARQRARDREPARAAVTGDKPLRCAITAPDAGACFFDEADCAAEAKTAGVSCETKTTGWCFDVTDVVGSKQTACAVSRVDCEARRLVFTSDRTSTVTTCGPYALIVRLDTDGN